MVAMENAVDANAYYGNWPFWDIPIKSGDAILRLMDEYNIEKAAIVSTKAIFLDWIQGNEEVLELSCRYSPRFIPFVTIGPFPELDVKAKLREYVERGVKGIKLFPLFHGYQLDESLLAREWTKFFNQEKLIINYPLRLFMNWGLPVERVAGLRFLIDECPQCPIVISGINYPEIMKVYPLLERSPNTFVETSCLSFRGGIDLLIKQIGVDRVLFGSGLPLQNPGPVLANISACKIDREQRGYILSKNFCSSLLKVKFLHPRNK